MTYSRRASIDVLESRRLLSAGDIDFTFGNSGFALVDFPGQPFQIMDVAFQPNGKIVLAGSKSGNVAATRLNADGTPDTMFGSGGLFESSLPASSKLKVVVQADNKPIIAYPGSLVFGFPPRLIRLTSGGFPDPSFGASGAAILPLTSFTPDLAVALQEDQKIVVAGEQTDGQDNDFGIVRINTNGSPDSSFGSNGLVTVGFGGFERTIAVAIDNNGTPATNPLWGSIVAVGGTGSTGHDIATIKLCRLTPQGNLDTSFDGDGKFISPQLSPAESETPVGVLIQPGGKIVIGGSAVTAAGAGDFLAARYLSSGGLDTSFGPSGTGVVQTDLGNFGGNDVALKMVPSFMGGFLISGRQNILGAVAAYTPDGDPDTRFKGGWFQSSLGPPVSIAVTGTTISPVRRFVLAGDSRVGRFIDLGPKVGLLNLNSVTSEATQATLGVIVVTERMPRDQKVYIDIGGTATPPIFGLPSNWDYDTSDITLIGFNNPRNYVTIPAGDNFTSFSITPINDTRPEGDETITLQVSPDLTYDIDGVPITLAIRDNDVTGGPTVSSSAFVYDSGPPQRVQFTFNQSVATSIGASDFTVTGPSGAVPFSFAYNDVTNTATLSFSGVLPDGNYTATAVAAGITNAGGTPMPGDHALPFFFLAGDADHDRDIDVNDLGILATNWQQSPRTFSQGDFDYSGTVDVNDLGILATRWQQQLAAIAPAIANPVRSSRSPRLIDQIVS